MNTAIVLTAGLIHSSLNSDPFRKAFCCSRNIFCCLRDKSPQVHNSMLYYVQKDSRGVGTMPMVCCDRCGKLISTRAGCCCRCGAPIAGKKALEKYARSKVRKEIIKAAVSEAAVIIGLLVLLFLGAWT